MKRALRGAGFGVLAIVGVLAIALVAIYGVSEFRMNRSYDVALAIVAVQADEETIARGRHVATIRGCVDCHGDDLAGKLFLDAQPVARLYSANLTAGEGGVGVSYTDADWVRAIRHGIGPNGKPLLYMPSHEFYPLSDEDTGALVAFLRSVQPVDHRLPASSVGPVGRLLFLLGKVPLVPAEMIDHRAARPAAPPPGVSVEYGAYLSTGCIGCHGEQYSGGRIPGAPPSFPAPTNLTPHETGLARWTEEDFFRALREGRRPDGSELDPFMPWQLTREMTDDEIRAMWMYMQTLEPRAYGLR
jgi:mono/diheme cytochrome c family protein